MEKIKAYLIGGVISSNSQEAYSLHQKSGFGEIVGEKIQYSSSEALFLLEKGKINVFQGKKSLTLKELMKKISKYDKRIGIKYLVFKDLRERGYIVKTALKFGADFRVYEKGVKPGEEHAKWIVFADSESRKMTWHELSAKNRVAHSTRKTLLLGLVDEEGDITYYEVRWIKP
ncbi:MAG: tRNA-intron lyase [Candidatus Pacearchaeota archaeon]